MENKIRTIPWKEGKVVSIQLRNGIYILAQMAKDPYMIFFNFYSKENDWHNVELSTDNVLFCCAVVRQFIKRSQIEVIKTVKPLPNYQLPTRWIFANGNSDKKMLKINDKEREVIVIGNSFSVAERDMINHRNNVAPNGLYHTLIIPEITPQHWKDIEGIESATLATYPELNERLYLCYQERKNVNPYLDIRLGKELLDSYGTYIDILSGVPINELGY